MRIKRARPPACPGPIIAPGNGKQQNMLAIIAAIIFGIGWILNATGTATNSWFSITSLLFIGLVLLALHQAGIGSAWVRRR
jgi:uncharacterized membrane protein YedE/YeeE